MLSLRASAAQTLVQGLISDVQLLKLINDALAKLPSTTDQRVRHLRISTIDALSASPVAEDVLRVGLAGWCTLEPNASGPRRPLSVSVQLRASLQVEAPGQLRVKVEADMPGVSAGVSVTLGPAAAGETKDAKDIGDLGGQIRALVLGALVLYIPPGPPPPDRPDTGVFRIQRFVMGQCPKAAALKVWPDGQIDLALSFLDYHDLHGPGLVRDMRALVLRGWSPFQRVGWGGPLHAEKDGKQVEYMVDVIAEPGPARFVVAEERASFIADLRLAIDVVRADGERWGFVTPSATVSVSPGPQAGGVIAPGSGSARWPDRLEFVPPDLWREQPGLGEFLDGLPEAIASRILSAGPPQALDPGSATVLVGVVAAIGSDDQLMRCFQASNATPAGAPTRQILAADQHWRVSAHPHFATRMLLEVVDEASRGWPATPSARLELGDGALLAELTFLDHTVRGLLRVSGSGKTLTPELTLNVSVPWYMWLFPPAALADMVLTNVIAAPMLLLGAGDVLLPILHDGPMLNLGERTGVQTLAPVQSAGISSGGLFLEGRVRTYVSRRTQMKADAPYRVEGQRLVSRVVLAKKPAAFGLSGGAIVEASLLMDLLEAGQKLDGYHLVKASGGRRYIRANANSKQSDNVASLPILRSIEVP